jgi:hypothetical protein
VDRVELKGDGMGVSIRLPIVGTENSRAQLSDEVAIMRSFPMQLKRTPCAPLRAGCLSKASLTNRRSTPPRMSSEHFHSRLYIAQRCGDYEVDHLLPLEVGGSNDIKNRWPQPTEKLGVPMGAHAKDRLENYLHRQVCWPDETGAGAARYRDGLVRCVYTDGGSQG